MSRHDESFRWYFDRLLSLASEGQSRAEQEDICQKLLVHGHEAVEPLAVFILDQQETPALGILLELLGKMGDPRAAAVLLEFLESDHAVLRMQAATGLGWLRARLALEALDKLEGTDPDPDVRREARIAVEEILREFPRLGTLLKHHKPVPLGDDDPAIEDEAAEIDEGPLTSGERRLLSGILPRMLALRYHAVPIRLEADGVISLAIPIEEDKAPDPEDLARVTGCQVQLHPWPIEHIYESILNFYEQGDDDWLDSENLAEAALNEIIDIVLSRVAPDSAQCAMPDCTDAIEAVQSLLALGLGSQFIAASVEYDSGTGAMEVALQTIDGSDCEIDPPPPGLRARVVKALIAMARCEEKHERGAIVARGHIRRDEIPPLDIGLHAEFRGKSLRVFLDFLGAEGN